MQHKTYRVDCTECDQFGDVPDFDAAVDWEAAHKAKHPTHNPNSEPYPYPMVFPLDPSALKNGDFFG